MDIMRTYAPTIMNCKMPLALRNSRGIVETIPIEFSVRNNYSKKASYPDQQTNK